MGKKLASKITKPRNNFGNLTPINPSTLFLRPTNETEVKKLIRELKSNKAPGIDDITSEILKHNAIALAPALTIIVNKIFETSTCPRAFKVAIIKPLYKNGDKTLPENYRPISLITSLAKIFEKILKVRLTQFFDKFKIISDSQYGFQKNKSTEDALIHLISKIQEALDTSNRSLSIFIDLAKAFDTVNHDQLLESLDASGIRGNVNKLFESYLKDRPQYVKIGNTISEESTVECGVPQGTVLGPILFTIYVNDLFNLPCEGKIIAFADDTAIIYQDKTWDNLKQKVENDLQLIKNWFDHKLLTINFAKTKYIPFTCHNYNLPTFNNIHVYTSPRTSIAIEPTECIKYLGVHIDKHLKWNIHLEKLIKKLRGILFKFKILKRILDTKNIKTIYFGLVQSLLEYGITGWGTATNNYLRHLETIHKRFLKIMFNKEYRYPTVLLYKETKMFSIRQLYFKNLILHQYKNKKDLTKAKHQYLTRDTANEMNEIHRAGKQIGQKTFKSLGPRMFNLIPKALRNSNNLAVFKNGLRKWMEQKNHQYFKSIIETYI